MTDGQIKLLTGCSKQREILILLSTKTLQIGPKTPKVWGNM